MWRVGETLGRVWCVIALVVSVLAAASAARGGEIVHVDDDAPPGGDGLGWPTAYRFLQDAFADAASSGGTVNEIRVAGGSYKPDRTEATPGGTGDRAARFQLLNGVAVRGGYLGLSAGTGDDPDERDITLFETILLGDLNDDDVIFYPVQWDNGENNSYHVVSGAGVDTTAMLDGVTIRQGFATPDTIGPGGLQIDDGSPSISQCTFLLNGGFLGGGVRILSGQPSITGCTFINNQAAEGAGVYIEGGRPTFTDCAFVDNSGFGVGGGVSIRDADPRFVDCLFAANVAVLFAGAGVSNFNGNPILEGCTFVGNDAVDFGGGFHSSGGNPVLVDCRFESNIVIDLGLGGGMAHQASEGPALATLINCTFNENTALELGGGYFNSGPAATSMLIGCVFRGNLALAGGGGIFNDGTSVLIGCRFVDNTGQLGGGGAANAGHLTAIQSAFLGNVAETLSGGGIFQNAPAQSLSVVDCVFSGNQAIDRGGAIASQLTFGDSFSVVNSTLTANTASNGGGIFNDGGAASIANTIVWGNVGDEISGPATVTYSDIEGGHPGAGNIDSDPLFVDAEGSDGVAGTEDDDLRLASGSPCIDAADNSAVPADAFDLDDDTNTAEPIPFDLAGRPRFADDPDTPDTGLGHPPIVDMGAHELPPVLCPQDVNGDGAINVLDLIELLLCFGQPATPPCDVTDINADGTVNVLDLIELLLAFGTACP